MIYDVTVPITNTMPVWPSDPPVSLTPNSHLSRDQSYEVHVTEIKMGSHTGTHIDAPHHFIKGGRKLHEIPLEQLVGPATVVDMSGVRSIGRSDLEVHDWSGIDRVLFKTENSRHWQDSRFYEEYVYLETDGAEFLAERGMKLVGIDYLSIEKFKPLRHTTHFALLTRNIVILEGLNLADAGPGQYHLMALPLNLQHADGAPTRVILMNE